MSFTTSKWEMPGIRDPLRPPNLQHLRKKPMANDVGTVAAATTNPIEACDVNAMRTIEL